MYRIKHKATGLYWKDSEGNDNTLTKAGKVFNKTDAENKLKEKLVVYAIHDTQSQRKCASMECWHKEEEIRYGLTKYSTDKDDWEIEPIQL